MSHLRSFHSLFLAIFLCVFSGLVSAADAYPSKEIRIIVASGIGGSIDRMSRAAQKFLPDILGVSVLVENHKGAGGKIGIRHFLKQPADGHTILVFGQPALTIVQKKAPDLYQMDDFSYVNIQWVDPVILLAHKDTGWKSLDDMVEAARKEPGKYSFSLADLTSTGAIMGQLLFKKLGLDIKSVPYDSGGSARTALRGHHVDMTAGGSKGARTVADVSVPLGVFWNSTVPSWPNAPLMNDALKKYNVTVPDAGSIRFFAMHTAFKENHPDRWKIIVDAFRKMVTEDEGFKAFTDKAKIGREWHGPDGSAKIAMDAHEFFKDL